MGEVTDE